MMAALIQPVTINRVGGNESMNQTFFQTDAEGEAAEEAERGKKETRRNFPVSQCRFHLYFSWAFSLAAGRMSQKEPIEAWRFGT